MLDANREKTAEGQLEESAPVLEAGSNPISFACASVDRGQIKLVKVYE